MTRRLTISGSRSEMGLLEDSPVEPETPPPSWSPAKYDIWKKPSRWQICMPRLRMVAKIVATFVFFILLIKIMNATPPPEPAPSEPEPEVADPVIDEITEPPPPPPLTEEELMEMTMQNAKKEQWIWKDFTT
jgi:hypothetical protein